MNTPLNPDAIEHAIKEVYGDGPRMDWPSDMTGYQTHRDYARTSVEQIASAYLGFAQPVVNSVEELDALPHGTVIMATGGQPNPDYPELFLKAGYEWSPWQALDPSDRDDGENMESSGSVLKWRCDGEARVLYRPAVNDA